MRLFCIVSLIAGAAYGQPSITGVADLEAFVDGQMAAHLHAHHVPGATIAVVYQGEILLVKGYGYADLEANTPVDGDTSMFMIGSVSKTFTWTAAMKLVEEGKLDLEKDVADYVPAGIIPPYIEQPITYLDLMNHTPGLEDRGLYLFAKSHEDIKPLEEVLMSNPLSRQVRPPGTLASYSNHGSALAGYIVERIQEKPWTDCMEEMILNPLRMEHTLVHQPSIEDTPENMAVGYKFEKGAYEVGQREYVPLAPAGCIASSAGDMARYMLMHLNDGEYDGARILSGETAREMQSRTHVHHDRVAGIAHGLIEEFHNGIRFVGHGGDTLLFHSQMIFAPELGFGLFVSYNAVGGTQARGPLLDAILDRYFPAEVAPLPEPGDESIARSQEAAGTYLLTRRNFSTFESVAAFASPLNITALEDGNILLPGDPPSQWAEVEPYIYRNVLNEDLLVFEKEGDRIARGYLGAVPIIAAERMRGAENPVTHSILLNLSMVILASAILFAPLGSYIAWRAKEKPKTPFLVRYGSALLGLMALSFVAGMFYLLSAGDQVVYGMPGWTGYLKNLALLMIPIVFALCVVSLFSWPRRDWNLISRIYFSSVSLAGVAFIVFLLRWKLFTL